MVAFTIVKRNILRLRRSLLGGQKRPPKGALRGHHAAQCGLRGGTGGPREPLRAIQANRERVQNKISEIALKIIVLVPHGGSKKGVQERIFVKVPTQKLARECSESVISEKH